jgi:hypothetical protein
MQQHLILSFTEEQSSNTVNKNAMILTDSRVGHYDHHIRIGCKYIDKRCKTRISNFHTLKVSMKFTTKTEQVLVEKIKCK